jgi:hypothetical protein
MRQKTTKSKGKMKGSRSNENSAQLFAKEALVLLGTKDQ